MISHEWLLTWQFYFNSHWISIIICFYFISLEVVIIYIFGGIKRRPYFVILCSISCSTHMWDYYSSWDRHWIYVDNTMMIKYSWYHCKIIPTVFDNLTGSGARARQIPIQYNCFLHTTEWRMAANINPVTDEGVVRHIQFNTSFFEVFKAKKSKCQL